METDASAESEPAGQRVHAVRLCWLSSPLYVPSPQGVSSPAAHQ